MLANRECSWNWVVFYWYKYRLWSPTDYSVVLGGT